MAKIEGTQTVPSEILESYKGNLTPAMPDGTVRARFPFRIPAFQSDGKKVTAEQIAQRTRFLAARDKFSELGPTERQRWYEARPPWGSLLWYYNYFILSALNGVLGAINPGAVVIRSIQNQKLSIPSTGAWITFATTVIPEKVVIMIWGGAHNKDTLTWQATAIAIYEGGSADTNWPEYAAWAWPIFPVWDSLNSSSLWIGWAETPAAAANVAVQIIEYI